MPKAKTSSFTLTETLTIVGGTFGSETIDLGSYIDVADRQGLAIESVDFIFQEPNENRNFPQLGGNETATAQLFDRNRTSLALADNLNLIASGSLHEDDNNGYQAVADVFPDNFGKDADARLVVNDQLYLIGNSTAGAQDCNVTVRIRCKIVTLSAKDWMAIAIQSTTADN